MKKKLPGAFIANRKAKKATARASDRVTAKEAKKYVAVLKAAKKEKKT